MRILWTIFGLLALATVVALAMHFGAASRTVTPGPVAGGMAEAPPPAPLPMDAEDFGAPVDDASDDGGAAAEPTPADDAPPPPDWFPGATQVALADDLPDPEQAERRDDALTSTLPPGAVIESGAPIGGPPPTVGGPPDPSHEGHQPPPLPTRDDLPPPTPIEDLPEMQPLEGSGTEEDPYRISWDDLALVRQTYRVAPGQRTIPPHVGRLDGRWVTLNGYFLTPWGGGEIEELVLMRFMWDGCCIGIPPTAFTAIEAKLTEPADRNRLLRARLGRLTGRLLVDPYEERGWLLALYLVEDGTFTPATGG